MNESKSASRSGIESAKSTLTADELIKKLRSALQKDGDFPVSAKIVGELRQLTSDPKTTGNQVTELILREPSLGTRVLHLVNSSFYRRAKPIMTVSQAVVQIGMKPLAEMCSGLVLLQKFVPAARRGGSFANCLRKTVVTSLLSSAITANCAAQGGIRAGKSGDEFGYLAGSFTELGTLLLAFYFPQIYESAVKRAEAKKQEIGQSIKELIGLSPAQLSIEVIDALQLPAFYKEVLSAVDGNAKDTSPDAQRVSKVVSAARTISEVVVTTKTKEDLDRALGAAKSQLGVEIKVINKIVGELPDIFKNHCQSIDLQLPELPEFVDSYAEGADSRAGLDREADLAGHDENRFNEFVTEIRQAVESREPTASIITSVMETLAWSLEFDRVLLMLVAAGKTKLVGRLLLGSVPNFDPKNLERRVGSDAPADAPDAKAFREGRPVFEGQPLFKDGGILAALPIGFGQHAIGVVYADRERGRGDKRPLSPKEQTAIQTLAELLDRSIKLQS